jgi:magnesium transporter
MTTGEPTTIGVVATRTCHRSPGGQVRIDLPEADLASALSEPDGLVWVDITANGRAEGERILRDVFHFHELTIDDCYNTLIDPPKVDDYGEYLFVIVHNVTYDRASEELFTNELDLYIGLNYVVSVHRSEVRAIEEVRRRVERDAPLLDRGAAFLAHALIDVVVDDFQPVVEAIDERVDYLEERVLDLPQRQTLQEVLRLKRNALRLRRTMLPQRDVVTRFARGEYPKLIYGESLMYFRDVYDHTVRVGEMIESVRDLAESALNTYLSSVNNRTNEVMKTLAIVAVIFLPLTLVASVYGTNFETTFPSYDWGPGFAGMVLSMLASVGALAAFFRWRRWF